MSNVDMKEVSVPSCSSEAVPHPLSTYTYKAQCTLEPGDKSCWISRGGNARPEWIVYCLGPDTRRVDFVSMSIPVSTSFHPLPSPCTNPSLNNSISRNHRPPAPDHAAWAALCAKIPPGVFELPGQGLGVEARAPLRDAG